MGSRRDLERLDDAALLAAIADADVLALRCLYDRHAPWLLVRLRHRCHDGWLVADVVEDTFLAVWRSAGTWRGEGDVAAWIWGIGVRRLVSHVRQAGRAGRVLPPAPIAHAASAEDGALGAMVSGEVAGALGQLSPELLAVVQAMVFDGLTAKETGRLLGLPLGTVKGRMRKAKTLLREELGATRIELGDLR